MSGVARDQLQALPSGNGGDHRIGQANGLTDLLQVTGDAAGQLASGLVEGKHFLQGDGGHEVLQLSLALVFLETPYYFHHSDGRECQDAMSLTISGSIAGDGRIDRLEDFGIDIRIKQGFIQRRYPAKILSRRLR